MSVYELSNCIRYYEGDYKNCNENSLENDYKKLQDTLTRFIANPSNLAKLNGPEHIKALNIISNHPTSTQRIKVLVRMRQFMSSASFVDQFTKKRIEGFYNGQFLAPSVVKDIKSRCDKSLALYSPEFVEYTEYTDYTSLMDKYTWIATYVDKYEDLLAATETGEAASSLSNSVLYDVKILKDTLKNGVTSSIKYRWEALQNTWERVEKHPRAAMIKVCPTFKAAMDGYQECADQITAILEAGELKDTIKREATFLDAKVTEFQRSCSGMFPFRTAKETKEKIEGIQAKYPKVYESPEIQELVNKFYKMHDDALNSAVKSWKENITKYRVADLEKSITAYKQLRERKDTNGSIEAAYKNVEKVIETGYEIKEYNVNAPDITYCVCEAPEWQKFVDEWMDLSSSHQQYLEETRFEHLKNEWIKKCEEKIRYLKSSEAQAVNITSMISISTVTAPVEGAKKVLKDYESEIMETYQPLADLITHMETEVIPAVYERIDFTTDKKKIEECIKSFDNVRAQKNIPRVAEEFAKLEQLAEKIQYYVSNEAKELYGVISKKIASCREEMETLKTEAVGKELCEILYKDLEKANNAFEKKDAERAAAAVDQLRVDKAQVDSSIQDLLIDYPKLQEAETVVDCFNKINKLFANTDQELGQLLIINAETKYIPILTRAREVLTELNKEEVSNSNGASSIIGRIRSRLQDIQPQIELAKEYSEKSTKLADEISLTEKIIEAGKAKINELAGTQAVNEFYPTALVTLKELEKFAKSVTDSMNDLQKTAALKKVNGYARAIEGAIASLKMHAEKSVTCAEKAEELETKLKTTMSSMQSQLDASDINAGEQIVEKAIISAEKARTKENAEREIIRIYSIALSQIWPMVFIHPGFAPYTRLVEAVVRDISEEARTEVNDALKRNMTKIEGLIAKNGHQDPSIKDLIKPIRERYLYISEVATFVFNYDEAIYKSTGLLPPSPLIVNMSIISEETWVPLPIYQYDMGKASTFVADTLSMFNKNAKEINENYRKAAEYLDAFACSVDGSMDSDRVINYIEGHNLKYPSSSFSTYLQNYGIKRSCAGLSKEARAKNEEEFAIAGVSLEDFLETLDLKYEDRFDRDIGKVITLSYFKKCHSEGEDASKKCSFYNFNCEFNNVYAMLETQYKKNLCVRNIPLLDPRKYERSEAINSYELKYDWKNFEGINTRYKDNYNFAKTIIPQVYSDIIVAKNELEKAIEKFKTEDIQAGVKFYSKQLEKLNENQMTMIKFIIKYMRDVISYVIEDKKEWSDYSKILETCPNDLNAEYTKELNKLFNEDLEHNSAERKAKWVELKQKWKEESQGRVAAVKKEYIDKMFENPDISPRIEILDTKEIYIGRIVSENKIVFNSESSGASIIITINDSEGTDPRNWCLVMWVPGDKYNYCIKLSPWGTVYNKTGIKYEIDRNNNYTEDYCILSTSETSELCDLTNANPNSVKVLNGWMHDTLRMLIAAYLQNRSYMYTETKNIIDEENSTIRIRYY